MSTVLVQNPAVSREEAEALMRGVSWFHRVEVLEGLVGNGYVPPEGSYNFNGYLDSLGFGPDLTGQRILEIGTWDGPLAYALKQRGADVVAADIQDPAKTGFNVIGTISGLSIPYRRVSVYDLHAHFKNEYDVVLFLGVFYHLKYPVLAFESIARTMKMGATIIAEGAGIGPYVETLAGEPVAENIHGQIGALLELLDQLRVPLAMAYPGSFRHGHNWFLPNKTALCGWLQNAGLEPESVLSINGGNRGEKRLQARAKKIRDDAYLEHSLTGEAGGFSLLGDGAAKSAGG